MRRPGADPVQARYRVAAVIDEVTDAAGEDEKIGASQQSHICPDCFSDREGKNIQSETRLWIVDATIARAIRANGNAARVGAFDQLRRGTPHRNAIDAACDEQPRVRVMPQEKEQGECDV